MPTPLVSATESRPRWLVSDAESACARCRGACVRYRVVPGPACTGCGAINPCQRRHPGPPITPADCPATCVRCRVRLCQMPSPSAGRHQRFKHRWIYLQTRLNPAATCVRCRVRTRQEPAGLCQMPNRLLSDQPIARRLVSHAESPPSPGAPDPANRAPGLCQSTTPPRAACIRTRVVRLPHRRLDARLIPPLE
jgi:hypothetical protein